MNEYRRSRPRRAILLMEMDDGTQMGWDVDVQTADIATEAVYPDRIECDPFQLRSRPIDHIGTVTITGRYRARIQQGDPHFEPQPGIEAATPELDPGATS